MLRKGDIRVCPETNAELLIRWSLVRVQAPQPNSLSAAWDTLNARTALMQRLVLTDSGGPVHEDQVGGRLELRRRLGSTVSTPSVTG